MRTKVLDQEEQVVSDHFQGLGRLGRLDHGECARLFLAQIAISDFRGKSCEQLLLLAFEIDQELLDGGDKDTDATEMPHVGKNVHRVDALQRGIDCKHFSQTIAYGFEDCIVKSVLRHDGPHRPDTLLADIGLSVCVIGNIQGIMPLDIEGKLLDCLLVGEIMHVLENHSTHHGHQFVGRTAVGCTVMPGKQINRKHLADIGAKDPCPGVIQQLAALGIKMFEEVKHALCFVVFYLDHCLTLTC